MEFEINITSLLIWIHQKKIGGILMNHKIERVSENMLIVGVDVAKKTHWAQITDSRGITLCKPVRVENSDAGFKLLTNKINELLSTHNLAQAIIGFEPSGIYWRTIAWYFFDNEKISIVGVNPYHVKQLKELEDNAQTKSDRKDALVIAHLIRDGRFFDVYMPENEYAELRVLRRHRSQIVDKRKWAYNQVIGILDEYFPEYESIGFNISTISTRIILRSTPFPSDIIQTGKDQLRDKWLKHSKSKRSSYLNNRFAEEIYNLAQKSIGVRTGLNAVRRRLSDLLDLLDMFDSQIAQCESEMERLLERLDIGRYLTSVPGVGKVIAAGFIAETGELSRFEDWKQIRKLAGLNLVEQSSGKHKGKTRISKRGRPDLRCIIYQIGDKGMLVSQEMHMYYDYLRHRQTNQLKHNQAVLAVGIKLMRIMFHVVKSKEMYDPAKALGEVRLQQIYNAA